MIVFFLGNLLLVYTSQSVHTVCVGDVGGLMVSVLDSGSGGPGLRTGRGSCDVTRVTIIM